MLGATLGWLSSNLKICRYFTKEIPLRQGTAGSYRHTYCLLKARGNCGFDDNEVKVCDFNWLDGLFSNFLKGKKTDNMDVFSKFR